MKQKPTILRLSFSFRSRLSTSASTDILQSNVAPDVTSMKLSIPKPTSEMLPASTPAATAIKPSRVFHTIVKYSAAFRDGQSPGVKLSTHAYWKHTNSSNRDIGEGKLNRQTLCVGNAYASSLLAS